MGNRHVWLACCLANWVIIFSARAQDSVLSPVPTLWDKTINLRLGTGYKDNVLLSPNAATGSAFIASGLDVMLWRLPVEGTQFYFFFTGDDTRFLSGQEVKKEQSFIAQTQVKKEFGNHWKSALTLQYLYQDQVFDASTTETLFRTVKAQGHSLSIRPSIRRNMATNLWLEFEFIANRQFFKQPLDDYWQNGPKLTLGREYGSGSELNLSYELRNRAYDTREQTDSTGIAVTGSSLKFWQHDVELALRHHWDTNRHWRTVTKLGIELNQDNGSHYFDFDRYQISQQLRYRSDTWEVKGQAKVYRYDYRLQTISATDLTKRNKTLLVLNVRGEKKLTKSLKLFAELEHERSFANVSFDQYRVNTATAGIDWEF